ncbi:MAG: serine/threonine-protein phosphatase, partial [Desulfobacteraceae bacterium]
GHRGGEVASRMVVETMAHYWTGLQNNRPQPFLETIDRDVSQKAKHLINSIILSNMVIHEAQKNSQYHRMGSTISALLLDEDCIWAANVGDSPVFIFDNGRLVLISEEHSIEGEQKSRGITDMMGETNPMLKNILTRALGLSPTVEVYVHPIRPDAGDIMMICSDGLTNYISKQAIRLILSDRTVPLEKRAEILVEEANRSGGGDNISVILLEVLEVKNGNFWQRFKKDFLLKKF